MIIMFYSLHTSTSCKMIPLTIILCINRVLSRTASEYVLKAAFKAVDVQAREPA